LFFSLVNKQAAAPLANDMGKHPTVYTVIDSVRNLLEYISWIVMHIPYDMQLDITPGITARINLSVRPVNALTAHNCKDNHAFERIIKQMILNSLQ